MNQIQLHFGKIGNRLIQVKDKFPSVQPLALFDIKNSFRIIFMYKFKISSIEIPALLD